MNIAIINQGCGRYLFEVPANIALKEGDRVKCDTRKGITDGVVFCDSAEVEEPAAKLIGKLLGAKFPLESVVGKTVTSVEMLEQPEQPKQEDKPRFKVGDMVKVIGNGNPIRHFAKVGSIQTVTHVFSDSVQITECYQTISFADLEPYTEPESTEPKQEPVKLYCVKESDVSRVRGSLTKGKVYEFDGHFIEYDSGTSARFNDFESWKRGDPNYAACLVPLVSRTAQVGEWVYLVKEPLVNAPDHCDGNYVTDYHKGDIAKITAFGIFASVAANNPAVFAGFRKNEYLVLDGYKPEPEKAEPEYLNMRVVCVAGSNGFTVGKPYEFRNGVVVDDNGDVRPDNENIKIESLSDLYLRDWENKFIEFKGE